MSVASNDIPMAQAGMRPVARKKDFREVCLRANINPTTNVTTKKRTMMI
jgi:hypothetical protein